MKKKSKINAKINANKKKSSCGVLNMPFYFRMGLTRGWNEAKVVSDIGTKSLASMNNDKSFCFNFIGGYFVSILFVFFVV